jgi:hypothetical protein
MYDYCAPEFTTSQEERAERAAYYRLLRVAARCTALDWVMATDDQRRKIHRRGLLRLVHAAGWLMGAWRRLSAEIQASVIRVGARLLGIDHDWRGAL